MELGAPLYDFDLVSEDGSLAVALVLGLAFGFLLVLAVTVLAAAAFLGAERVEAAIRRRGRPHQPD